MRAPRRLTALAGALACAGLLTAPSMASPPAAPGAASPLLADAGSSQPTDAGSTLPSDAGSAVEPATLGALGLPATGSLAADASDSADAADGEEAPTGTTDGADGSVGAGGLLLRTPGEQPATSAERPATSGDRPAPGPEDADEDSLLSLVRIAPPADELPDDVDAAAWTAGIRGDLAGAEGSGSLRVVEGSEPAPREAERTYRVRVEVERGLPMDRQTFADYVMDTLNDPRGWGHDGSVAFERVDGEDADFGVTLADGPLSIELCAPLDVGGIYSCGRDGRAVLNADRFAGSIDAFLEAGGTVRQYRQYLVNHEVGHLIGHQHVDCPAPGEPAPVMVQQSMGLQGCRPNAWAAHE